MAGLWALTIYFITSSWSRCATFGGKFGHDENQEPVSLPFAALKGGLQHGGAEKHRHKSTLGVDVVLLYSWLKP
jgi:hypothetical protein